MAIMFDATGNDFEVSNVKVTADNVAGDTCIEVGFRGRVRHVVLDWACGSTGKAINVNGDHAQVLGAYIATTGTGIAVGGDDCQIAGSYVSAFQWSVDAAAGEGVSVDRCTLVGSFSGTGGVRLVDHRRAHIVNNQISRGTNGLGIATDWTATPAGVPDGIKIQGNTVIATGTPLQVAMTDTTDLYRGLRIVDNYFEGGGECTVDKAPAALINDNVFDKSALGVSNSKGVQITDNEFTESVSTLPTGWTGIVQVDACDSAHVSGNTHSGSALATGDGFIQLTGSLSDAFVNDNAYTGPIPGGAATFLDYGLIIDSGCSAVLVGINDFRLANTAPVLDNGTATVAQVTP